MMRKSKFVFKRFCQWGVAILLVASCYRIQGLTPAPVSHLARASCWTGDRLYRIVRHTRYFPQYNVAPNCIQLHKGVETLFTLFQVVLTLFIIFIFLLTFNINLRLILDIWTTVCTPFPSSQCCTHSETKIKPYINNLQREEQIQINFN